MNGSAATQRIKNQDFISRQLLSELKVRHLANLLIGFSIFVVLGVTLYPFDFTTYGFEQRLTPYLHPKLDPLDRQDIITNIILFLPIGFSFGILANRRRLGPVIGFLVVTLAGALLSFSVETSQLFLPFRFSSFIDVSSNALGSSLGYVLYKLIGPPVYRALTAAIQRGNRGETTGWLATGYLFLLLCVLMFSVPFQESSLLNQFDKSTYPLLIGNEPTGDRPWSGTIKDLIITKNGLSSQGVVDYMAGRALNAADSIMVVAHYELSGRAPYKDLRKLHSPLEWRGRGIDTTESDRALITPHRWLQTKNEAYEMTSWMMETQRFTICATVSARANQNPSWKSRIVSVSGDPYHSDFALAQNGRDLGLRFRSMTTGMNGTNPQFVVPDVFTDTSTHRIVASLECTHVNIYVDSLERHYELELGPGFALLNRFFPSSGRLDISRPMKDFHNYLFDVIVFVPLAYILGSLVKQLRLGIVPRILIACTGIAAPPVLLEQVLQHLTDRDVNMHNIVVGWLLMLATVILTLLSGAVSQKKNQFPEPILERHEQAEQ